MFELNISKIKEQGVQFVDTARKAAMDIADKSKNQLDLAGQQNQLAKAERQLGTLVYSLYKSGEKNEPLVQKYIENIEAIEKSIEEIKARMTPEEQAAASQPAEEAEEPKAAEPKAAKEPVRHGGLDEEQLDELAAAADRPRGETKTCPVCHSEVDADALFCNHCGAQL